MDRFAMGRFAASLRAERGVSSDDLACFIGSTPRRLLALENGRGMLPPDSFRALADYLNVSIAELFAGRRFTGTDAPEDVSAARADADSYLRFCAACRSPRIRLRRVAAALIDGVLIVFLWGVLVALLQGWDTIAPACVMLALWLLHDATGRCSAGKYILRLRIVNARTLAPASLWRRVVRNLPLLPCSMLVSPILFSPAAAARAICWPERMWWTNPCGGSAARDLRPSRAPGAAGRWSFVLFWFPRC